MHRIFIQSYKCIQLLDYLFILSFMSPNTKQWLAFSSERWGHTCKSSFIKPKNIHCDCLKIMKVFTVFFLFHPAVLESQYVLIRCKKSVEISDINFKCIIFIEKTNFFYKIFLIFKWKERKILLSWPSHSWHRIQRIQLRIDLHVFEFYTNSGWPV